MKRQFSRVQKSGLGFLVPRTFSKCDWNPRSEIQCEIANFGNQCHRTFPSKPTQRLDFNAAGSWLRSRQKCRVRRAGDTTRNRRWPAKWGFVVAAASFSREDKAEGRAPARWRRIAKTAGGGQRRAHRGCEKNGDDYVNRTGTGYTRSIAIITHTHRTENTRTRRGFRFLLLFILFAAVSSPPTYPCYHPSALGKTPTKTKPPVHSHRIVSIPFCPDIRPSCGGVPAYYFAAFFGLPRFSLGVPSPVQVHINVHTIHDTVN